MIDFLFVGIGGFLGSCLRFAINKATVYYGISFPLGTLLSNVIAGIAIGFVVGLEPSSQRTRLFITTGLLGGLSTFSTFSLETVNLFRDGKQFWGIANALLNLGLSLFAVLIGMYLSRLIVKKA